MESILDEAKMTENNPSRVRTILTVVLLVLGSASGGGGVLWAYQQRPIAELSIEGPKAWQFQGIPVNSSSYGFVMPITVKLRNEGNTGVNLRVIVEPYNADVVWKKGGGMWLSSSSETRYVGAHSPEVLTFYVLLPKSSSFKIAARIEFVQDYSGLGPMITTFIVFFGETPKDGPTTLEYRVGDGDVWSLFWEE
jgi:hypothetical protein